MSTSPKMLSLIWVKTGCKGHRFQDYSSLKAGCCLLEINGIIKEDEKILSIKNFAVELVKINVAFFFLKKAGKCGLE